MSHYSLTRPHHKRKSSFKKWTPTCLAVLHSVMKLWTVWKLVSSENVLQVLYQGPGACQVQSYETMPSVVPLLRDGILMRKKTNCWHLPRLQRFHADAPFPQRQKCHFYYGQGHNEENDAWVFSLGIIMCFCWQATRQISLLPSFSPSSLTIPFANV